MPKKEEDCLSLSGDGGFDGVLADLLSPPSMIWPEVDLVRPVVVEPGDWRLQDKYYRIMSGEFPAEQYW